MSGVTRFGGRRFQLWCYGVSHKSLLLMSPMDEGCSSRICVFFKGVDHIDLDTLLDITEIRELPGPDSKRFLIQTPKRTFEIAALAMFVEADTLDHSAPNIFDRAFSLP